MPSKPLRPCGHPGCGTLTKTGRCEEHARKPWEKPRLDNRKGGRPWRRLRKAILERDQHLCRCDECTATGRLLLATEVDHYIPLSEGGTDAPGNLRAINKECHRKKTQREARK